MTHIAPNLGVEKAVDYRCSDGRAGLAERVKVYTELCAERDLMLDCHSGDDLSRETRRCISRASGGRIHFKISPSLQMLFAEVLSESYPEYFRKWWDMTYQYVEAEAARGSEIAAAHLKSCDPAQQQDPSPHHNIFHNYHFAVVGLRNEKGGFINRELFYSLPEDFYRLYSDMLTDYLDETAEDVL